ncbi:glycosyltransferase [candidate division KSB1 bacterium]|nr:MAG: glycosyltransferase [candidate division KSB1 bacterium]
MHSDNKITLSVIVPLFNEQDSLEELFRRLKEVLTSQIPSHEIIFVDDGSQDRSFEILEKLAAQDEAVKVVQFQKNYGKSAALSMGFRLAKGEIVATLDADLQDDPAEIPKLLIKLNEGYDLVSGWKRKRRDPLSKTIPSRIFNFVISLFSGLRIHDINCGLKVYRRVVTQNLHPYGELHRFLPLLAYLDGFRVGEVVVEHHPRKYGRSKFGPSRFLSGFFDLITVMFLSRYMRKPLHLFGIVGLLSFLAGFAISLYLTILRLSGHWIGNRPLLFLGILLLILGVQFVSIGLIGEMITESQKKREDYAVRAMIGFEKN